MIKYLLAPRAYFTDRMSVPFFPGVVAVFMIGGFQLLSVVGTSAWAWTTVRHQSQASATDLAIGTLPTVFFTAFGLWIAVAGVFHVWVLWRSRETPEFLTTVAIVGLGFVPIACAAGVEFVATLTVVFTEPATVDQTVTRVVFSRYTSRALTGSMVLAYGTAITWSVIVWGNGIRQRCGGPPLLTTVIALVLGGTVAVVLFTQTNGIA